MLKKQITEDCSKVHRIKTVEPVQIYSSNCKKITIITNFGAFFTKLFFNCTLLDPDPLIE